MFKRLAWLILLSIGMCVIAKERMVYIVRHCQPGSKVRPIADDGGITELGERQSRLLGKHMKTLGFDGPIFASPYYRTVATACYAAAECGSKVYPDARVQERVARDGGNLKNGGAKLPQLRELFPQIADDAALADDWLLKTQEDYETSQQARLEKALDEILSEQPGKDIMIVSHAGAVAAYCRIFAKRSGEKVEGNTWNCCLFTFGISDEGKYRFADYTVSFMTPEETTSNFRGSLADKLKEKKLAIPSGIDEKQPTGDKYNFYFISDPHFGDPESYDMNPETNPNFRTKKDIHRANKAIPTYRALFADMAAKMNAETRFLLEGGDLIEGGCFNADTHAVQLQKQLDFLREYFKLPIYPVNGNHDSWGNGGNEAFQRVVTPFISKEIGMEVKNTNYTVKCGADLFVFADVYTPDARGANYIVKTLKELKEEPRYLFVVLHPNVIPFPTMQDVTEAIAKYNGIVICGHSHQTMLLEYECNGHTVTQFSIGTCLMENAEETRYKNENTDMQKYLGWFNNNYVSKEKHKKIMAEKIEPYLKRCWRAGGQGYARFDVSDSGVQVTVQSSDLKQEPFVLKVK